MEEGRKGKVLISIVVPIYQVESYLKDCVESILQQSYQQWEAILVDDGSLDESGRICDAYAKQDQRICVHHQKNSGLVSAWMAGVGLSKGEYLCFVDGDDWIDPDMLLDLVKQTTGEEKEIICSNYCIEKKGKRIPVMQSMPPGVYGRTELEEQLFPHLLGEEVRRIHSSRCMKLISRKLLLENLKFCNPALTMGEDLNIMLPLLLDANRMVVLEKGFYYHYRHMDSSMAHQYNPKLYEKLYQLYLTLQRVLEIKGRDKQLLEGLKKEYIFLLFLALKNELRGTKQEVVKRIQGLVQEAKEEEELNQLQLRIKGKANWLLYQIWRHPNPLMIYLGWLAIHWFDRREKKK